MGIFKDENGNSYGDWTHRGQGRTRENANDIVTTGDEKKWYDQTFWIIFFLVVLWPVGLVLMWRGACTWHVAVKIVVTIVLKQWLAWLHRPLGCSVRCATCARGTIPHPRPTQLFSQMKACYRGRRWRAFPIPYAVSPCARGRLRAS